MVTVSADSIYAERILIEVASLLTREEELEDQFHVRRAHAIACLVGELIPPTRNAESLWRNEVLEHIRSSMTDDAVDEWRRVAIIMRRTCEDLEVICGSSNDE